MRSRLTANSEASRGRFSRKSSRGVTTWNHGLSLAMDGDLSHSSVLELARVGVECPGTEITIGEGFRPSPVSDDHRGIASDRKPIRDRKPADDGLSQVANQSDAFFGTATIREDEPRRRVDAEDFPERIADKVIDRAVLQLEDGDRERPPRGRVSERNDVEGEILPSRDRQYLARIPFGGSSPSHCCAGFHNHTGQLGGPGCQLPGKGGCLERLSHRRPLESAEEMAAPALGEILWGHQFLSSSSATSTGGKPTGHQTPVSPRASIRPERLSPGACPAVAETQARRERVPCPTESDGHR